MKPIRKDEQEYLREYIKDKFRDKRSSLESDREVDVEEQAKKKDNIYKWRKVYISQKFKEEVDPFFREIKR